MATVLDVAAYILSRQGGMTAMKLQKLVYYAQAWSLVWDEAPLFKNHIQAWSNGPVSPALYHEHKGMFRVSHKTLRVGDAKKLSESEIDTIDRVLKHYGNKSGQWLSGLTHAERPWKDARKGLDPGERGDIEITHAAMSEYYGGL
jgi:uncharacterized phage-associated protein